MNVCITGTGVVCPSGLSVDETLAALLEHRCAIQALPAIEAYGLVSVAAGCCPSELSIPGVPAHLVRGVDRSSLFALAAAHQALSQAEQAGALARGTMPVVWGCSMGGVSTLDEAYLDILEHQKRRVRPATIPYTMPSAPAFQLAHHLDVRGPSLTLTVACASSALAIMHGARLIASGEASVVLVGGCDSMQTPLVLRAWQAAQAICEANAEVPQRSCAPFSKSRQGFAIAEGAACLILESAEHASQRGANVLGWVRGVGHTTDALHISRPDAPSQAEAMKQALAHAGVEPPDISYLNAHGTATVVGDLSEAQAVREVFGEQHPKLPISSTKAMHGHLIGGAGALEAIVTLEALRRGRLPGNPNSADLDPVFADLNIFHEAMDLPETSRRLGMSNSFAFGGVNAVLVLEAAHG
jgi:3-oxoacyl-[acyl-carrier-protein] synthase II